MPNNETNNTDNKPTEMDLADLSDKVSPSQAQSQSSQAQSSESQEATSKDVSETDKVYGDTLSPERERDAINEVPVRITAVLGEKRLPVRELIKLGRGAVVPLDRKLGAPVDIYANDRLIARGEVTIVEDDNIAVTMTEIMSAHNGI